MGDEESVKGGSATDIIESLLRTSNSYNGARSVTTSVATSYHAVMDRLANRETPATQNEATQLLINPAETDSEIIPAIIQHAVPSIVSLA